jgi:hypothetical protein
VHSMEQHLEIIKSIYNSILEPQKTTTLCY